MTVSFRTIRIWKEKPFWLYEYFFSVLRIYQPQPKFVGNELYAFVSRILMKWMKTIVEEGQLTITPPVWQGITNEEGPSERRRKDTSVESPRITGDFREKNFLQNSLVTCGEV